MECVMPSMANSQPLGKVCVLGLGRTGFGVVEYLIQHMPDRVESIHLYGGARSVPNEQTARFEGQGVHVTCGTDEIEGEYDLAIVSPGIPPRSAFFLSAKAHAKDLVGEPEFAWRESPNRWVGITGTNGKTTSTLLTAEIMNTGGVKAEAVGNIGVVATGEIADRPEDMWFVAELSSFQLATSLQLHPRVACLLNLTPDHIEWHGTLEEYAEAKGQMFRNLDDEDLAVVSVDDSWCRKVADKLEARGLRVCRVSVHGVPESYSAAFVRKGRLVVRLDGKEHKLVLGESLSLEGAHNMFNALVASAVALELGVTVEAVCHALMTFAPLEHRIEPCGTWQDVRFINDSKATNVDSVEKALASFSPGKIVVLLGGHDKGTELDSLAHEVSARCYAAVCYGEAGARIAEAIREADANMGLTVVEEPRMAEAFSRAVELARPGDVVLLSPACSSFDEFGSFQERGNAFKDLVKELGALKEAK